MFLAFFFWQIVIIYFLSLFSVAFLPPDLGDGQAEDGEREPADEEDCHQGDQEGTGPAGIRKSGDPNQEMRRHRYCRDQEIRRSESGDEKEQVLQGAGN